MKKSIILGLSILTFSANAQNLDIKKDVNWKDVSTSPVVSEQNISSTEKNLITENQIQDKNSSINLDFLQSSSDERIFYNFKAVLRILNKQNDTVKNYDIFPNQKLSLKGYDISVKSCAKVNIHNVKNDLAFVEVQKNGTPLYSGWMSNIHKSLSYPELRVLYMSVISCNKFIPDKKIIEPDSIK